jgi:hypothetical protein
MDGRRARSVLGVGNDAGPEEIRRAFRARAHTLHPDHGGNGESFGVLVDAFDTLRTISPALRPRRVLTPASARVDLFDSPRRPAPRRDFADVLRAATARLG